MFSLADVDAAVHELEWVLSRVRGSFTCVPLRFQSLRAVVHLPTVPSTPFWARVNEAFDTRPHGLMAEATVIQRLVQARFTDLRE
jgi:hypothetical protein